MNKTIKDLREAAALKNTEARNELEKVTDTMSAGDVKEHEARFDAAMADHDSLNEKADRQERMAIADKAQEEREAKGTRGNPNAGLNLENSNEQEERSPEYKEVFSKSMRFGNETLDAEERSILMSGRSNPSREERAQSTTNAAGGYTVPEGFSGEIDKALAAWGPMLDPGFARQYPTATGNPIPWPTVDTTADRARLKAEGAAADDDDTDDIVFGEKVLNSYLYDTGVVRTSIELLQDSAFNIESLLTDCFGESLGRTANEKLTTGTGSAQPNGVVTASSVGITAAGTAAITGDELIDFFHSVDPAYRMSPNARFMFNDSTLATIRKLKDGDGNYLWSMGDVQSGSPATFQGKAYSVNQAMADIGASSKPIVFGDFSRYIVRRVGGFQMVALRERYMNKLEVGFIGFMRLDGELLNTGAVKHLIQAAS